MTSPLSELEPLMVMVLVLAYPNTEKPNVATTTRLETIIVMRALFNTSLCILISMVDLH
jgi:hypothetical protein